MAKLPVRTTSYKKRRRISSKQILGIALLVVAILIVVGIVLGTSGVFSGKDKDVEKPSASVNTSTSENTSEKENTSHTKAPTKEPTEKPTESTSAKPTESTSKTDTTKPTAAGNPTYQNPGVSYINGTKYLNVSKNMGYVDSNGKVTFSVTDEYRNKYNYVIAVNRQQNVVTAYGKNSSGEYTVPVKAMLCSCGIKSPDGGIPTPAGSFLARRQDRWLLLVGNCWGQYTTGVYQSIYFHSVPYFTQNPADLQYNEFGKLGSPASHGCIRVSTADAKWIQENIPIGGLIYIYDSSVAGPLGKPANIPFDINSPNRGWDPTDPDSRNPWNN